MNDFTKEELQNILNGNVTLYPHTHCNLVNKIQSMIDNYCEHNRPYTKLGITVCLDCNEIIKNPDGIKINE